MSASMLVFSISSATGVKDARACKVCQSAARTSSWLGGMWQVSMM